MPGVEQNVAQVRQGGLAARTLPIQPRLRVRRRLVRVVAATLALEIDRRIPGIVRGRPRRTLAWAEALQARPGLQPCAVHGEVLIGELAGRAGLTGDRGEEGRGDLAAQQPVPILRKRRAARWFVRSPTS